MRTGLAMGCSKVQRQYLGGKLDRARRGDPARPEFFDPAARGHAVARGQGRRKKVADTEGHASAARPTKLGAGRAARVPARRESRCPARRE